MKNYISGIVERLSSGFSREALFGTPIELSNVTIIPVSKGCGTDLPAGPRYPLGYIEIREDNVRFIPLYDSMEMLILGGVSGIGLCLMAGAIKKAFTKPGAEKTVGADSYYSSKKGCCTLLKVLAMSAGVILAGCAAARLSSGRKASSDRTQINPTSGEKGNNPGAEHKGSAEWDSPGVRSIDESLD